MKQAIIYLFSSILLFTSCEKNDEPGKTYTINNETSKVEWKGYRANGQFNRGTFSVESIEVKTWNGKVDRTTFTIPILSLNVLNLEGDLKNQLEGHLKSPDFFNILLHPNARFELVKTEPYNKTNEDGVVAGANYLVTGNFTMLGVTRSISFPAKIVVGKETLEVEASFKINRFDWGMTYASDPAEQEHYIQPMVDLHLNVKGQKKQ